MLLSFHFPLWICSLECILSCWELECWYLLRPQALSSRRRNSIICLCCRLCSFGDAVMSMQLTPVLGLWHSKAVVPHYQTLSWKGVYGTDALWLLTVCCETTANFKTSPNYQFSLVQSLSHVRLFVTPWIAACQASLSITNSWSSPRLTSIESVMPSSHLILCRPLLFLPQSLSASEYFPMSQLFAWGGQSTGVSALA